MIASIAFSLETHVGWLTGRSASRYVTKHTSTNHGSISGSAGGGIAALTDILLSIAIVSVASKWQSLVKGTNSSV